MAKKSAVDALPKVVNPTQRMTRAIYCKQKETIQVPSEPKARTRTIAGTKAKPTKPKTMPAMPTRSSKTAPATPTRSSLRKTEKATKTEPVAEQIRSSWKRVKGLTTTPTGLATKTCS